ncbi:hypothetical protein LSCM1_05248 [Leishmania martiniquensis]|uniref:Uncharacterized protein n=1 Tax=Leishmania martiniquensis TaxID=1580590 RepID=A0A836KND3_9TRYP|nr:hypothetical protein LSCM1_05248 [Leishmania martiniquensis]
MPFLQWRAALTDTLATRGEAAKALAARWTATGICGARSVEAAGTPAGNESEAEWSSLSILHVFHLAHVAASTDPDVPAAVDDMSTEDLVTSVRRLLCMGQLPRSNFAASAAKGEAVSTYVARALLLRLRGLVETHERFLTWMHRRSRKAVPAVPDDAGAEESFLTEAATFLRTLPSPDALQRSAPLPPETERCEQSRRFSYAQLLSSNLYAISTFMDVAVVATTCTPPGAPASPLPPLHCGLHSPPNPIETTARTLLYFLITLIVDVLESSVLNCCQLAHSHFVPAHESERVRLSQVAGDFLATPTAAGRFSVSASASASASPASASLHVILCTVLQEEGSRLLERLLRYAQHEGRCRSESADMDPTHHRLLTRHVLRRVGPLFFHPLRAHLTDTGITNHTTAAVASDHTDTALVAWMAEQLQRIVPLRILPAEGEGPEKPSQDFPGGLTGEGYQPCRFEAESLAELLRLLVAQIDAGASPSPSAGVDECDCSSVTNHFGALTTEQGAPETAEGAGDVSRVPEYAMLFLPLISTARAQGGGTRLPCTARETLMAAREQVVAYARNLSAK